MSSSVVAVQDMDDLYEAVENANEKKRLVRYIYYLILIQFVSWISVELLVRPLFIHSLYIFYVSLIQN
jgi:hypothetical protein